MLLEPPGPLLHGRRPPAGAVELTSSPLRLGALVAAAALAATSSGEVVLLAVLLGVVAADVLVGVVAVLAGLAVAVRWGATSLDAVAGAQAVLGPGGGVGPAAAAASAWCGAAAVVLASPRGWPVVAFGPAAALGLAAPSAAGAGDVAVRVAAGAAGAALAWAASRRLQRPAAVRAALVLAVAGLGLALLS